MMYERLIGKLRDDTMWKNCEFDFIYSYMHEAADAIEELSKKLFYAELSKAHTLEIQKALLDSVKIPRWVPVEERLPELNKVVQITDGIDVGHGYLASITSTQNMVYPSWHSPFCDVDETHITHWMPLPKPPKDGEA